MKGFTLATDLGRIDQIKSSIKSDNKKMVENKMRSFEKQKEDFFKSSHMTDFATQRRKRILKTLKSTGFKERFYMLQKMERDQSLVEQLVSFFRKLYYTYTTKWKKKNRFEIIIDRLASYDEISFLEKRVRMAKYGIDPMVERDDDRDPLVIKNEVEEMTNYRKELGDFLKDDPEYQELKAKQDLTVTELDLYPDTHHYFVSSNNELPADEFPLK